MSFRLRRSIQIVPGVRFNVSKTGVGLGVGPRGLRYTAHSSGRRTFTARSGVPGLYWQEQHQQGRKRPHPRESLATAAPSLPKPGLFAPKGEKELYKAIREQAEPSVVATLGDDYPDYRVLAYSIAGLQMINDDHPEATRLLATAFGAGADPAAHSFARKYLATELELAIATGVTVHLPINRDAVGLALAELYQADGNPTQAIDTVEQLEPTAHAAVSLAELYLQVERYGDVVKLTEGITNQDDATALLLVFRAAAFREQGFYDAAHETFKEALRSRSRAPEIRHLALLERSRNFLAQGKKAPARKDLERILAEDSTYEGVRQQLAELTGASQA